MNKRIRKKRQAHYDAILADGIRLYATRPRGEGYAELARSILAMNIGLALYGRLELSPGTRRGRGVAPPTALVIDHEAPDVIRAHGTVAYLPPGDDAAGVDEMFHLVARRTPRGWRATLFTTADRPRIDVAAV